MDILKDVLLNPEKIEDLTEEQILSLESKFTPYSFVCSETENKCVAMSYTNIQEKYTERLVMTALIGFLFRLLYEWEVPSQDRRWTPKNQIREQKEQFSISDFDNMSEILSTFNKDLQKYSKQMEKLETEIDDMVESGFGSSTLQEDVEKLSKKREELIETGQAVQAAKYTMTLELRKWGLDADQRYKQTEEETFKFPALKRKISKLSDRTKFGKHLPSGQVEMPGDIAKKIIEKFLKSYFEFNPDAHVRKAYDEFVTHCTTKMPGIKNEISLDKDDPERLPLQTLVTELAKLESLEDTVYLRKILNSKELFNAIMFIIESDNSFKDDIKYVMDENRKVRFCAAFEGKRVMLKKDDRIQLNKITHNRRLQSTVTLFLTNSEAYDVYKYVTPKLHIFKVALATNHDFQDTSYALDILPPQDIFVRFAYYLYSNYEELRTITETLYNEKPYMENALILYKTFEGDAEKALPKFEKFRDEHQDDFIMELNLMEMNKWVITSSVKENREKISFLNKNTEVLKRILDRLDEDKKIGNEILKKRVYNTKAASIRESGPDTEGLKEYKKNTNIPSGTYTIPAEDLTALNKSEGDLRLVKKYKELSQIRKEIQKMKSVPILTKKGKMALEKLETKEKDLVEFINTPADALSVDVHEITRSGMITHKLYSSTKEITEEQNSSES